MRSLIAPLVVGLAAVAVHVHDELRPAETVEAIAAYRSGLYLEPWRAITSSFMHQSVPHLIFNLITLGFLGRRVLDRFGLGWFVALLLVGMFVGQVAFTLVAQGFVVGISGGICAHEY